MKKLKLSGLLYNASMAFVIATITSFNVCLVFFVLCLISFLPLAKGVAFMALQKEIWEKDILDNLYKNNDFAKRAFNADSFVVNGKIVHIPIAGTPSVIKKNLNAFPQVAVNRTDSEILYGIDTYYALPRQIQDIEKYELSYAKRESVVGEDRKKLIQEAMNGLLYRWSPGSAVNAGMAANIILTDGPTTGADLIDGTATGTRATFTKNAFKTVAKKFANTDNGDRMTGVLTANHYHQFFESLSDAEKTNFNNVADLKNGVIGRYMGIDILMRSSVSRYRGADLAHLVAVDEQDDAYAPSPDDRAASLFYTDSSVERAQGDVNVFDNPGQALYYGDVFSAYIRLGGRIRRANGVYAVVEDLGA